MPPAAMGLAGPRRESGLPIASVVKESGTYDIEFVLSAAGKGGSFHLELDGKDVTGPIEVPDTGSFQKLGSVTKKNVPS